MIFLTDKMLEVSSEHYDWYVVNPIVRDHCKTYNGSVICTGLIKDVERKLIEADLGETLELLQSQSIGIMDKKVDEFLVTWSMFKTFSYGFSFSDINNEILFKLTLE